MQYPALKVHQWLKEWDEVKFDAKLHRSKPQPFFYMFSMPAKDLRALCGVYPRDASKRTRGKDDLGSQRKHDSARSSEIGDFVKFGHPWAGLSPAKRASDDNSDLKKPGWLPTAIVVNILNPGEQRQGKQIKQGDSVKIANSKEHYSISLPTNYSGAKWESGSIPPIEVIDGQHRLWAFDDLKFTGDFELPVVAFHGLDVSWQAYLFYTINIKPKRINASLAFDLYPLLRTEEWLEKFEGAAIYRETRAQEVVDLLFTYPQSPWHNRINMLGETGTGRDMVSQAAWIRSLLATFVKSWDGKRVSVGGLFGAPVGSHEQVLPWTRQEQAAFLIFSGSAFKSAVENCKEPWAKTLRTNSNEELFKPSDDPAFYGKHTLISQDQGIRGFLNIVNDLCFVAADELKLNQWGKAGGRDDPEQQVVSESLASIQKTPMRIFIQELSQELSKFDWRASSAPGLSEQDRLIKGSFRGSGGYRDLRHQLLINLQRSKSRFSKLAGETIQRLGY